MRIADLMSKDVLTVASSEEARRAYEFMRSKGVRHLAVKAGARIVGVVSERDLGGPRGAAARAGKVVAELMSRDVVMVGPKTTVHDAATRMRDRAIGSLLVTDGSALRGIVTVSDLLTVLANGAPRRKRAPIPEGRPLPSRARSFPR